MKKVLLLLFAISLIALPCASNTNGHIRCKVIHRGFMTRAPEILPDIEQEGNNLYLSSEYYVQYNIQIMDENGEIVYDNVLPLSSNPQIITINNSGLYSINLFIGDIEYEGSFYIENNYNN
jgi:hypothetical protein